jgi:hypothetical protein
MDHSGTGDAKIAGGNEKSNDALVSALAETGVHTVPACASA